LKKKAKPQSFIQQPKYPGGKKALDDFVKSNLVYPEEAVKQRVEGNVTIHYDVDVFGKVSDAKVIHGIGYGCDEEALRVTKLLRYEKKTYRGMRVTHHQTINIHFRLPGSPPVQEQPNVQVTYHYKPSGSK
jgi:TonB family protein